ncbi:ABC transporter ATP-binding protein [Nonomuraea sp. MCN248]|uniref:ABC transporter ATP-binding protein n=2 Tax=Nonomuraea corallina TaxID=2989783 RepID=A0ABT4S8X0_9ACTN|nr:ABC transporter ATP-binding protein [Nonomuraea corallina]MDA0633667.1 ABC transporter ATP-binding protein [Nonomuraea corallina]
MMLSLDGIEAGYGGLRVLHGLSLEVAAGELVALVGANGAGKSTTLRVASGLLRPSAGRVVFDGEELTGLPGHAVVRRGLVQVPEGRALFGPLTVAENLAMGAFHTGEPADRVLELFPRLAERLDQRADTMSGGEQQMLAIGRALMTRPRLLMLDEPSVGLAPLMVRAVFDALGRIRESGVAILLVEQNAAQALALADRAYVLENGVITLSGTDLAGDERVRRAYLGL